MDCIHTGGTKMIYAISILQNTVSLHENEIKRLESLDYELQANAVFIASEIRERRDYIYQLKKAISALNKQLKA